jgi:hypothetical protein
MQSVPCTTRGCGAVYPDYARFCPRCGNANPRVMAVAQPPQASPKSCGWGAPRGSFRFFWLLFIVPWIIISRFNAHNSHVNPQPPQPVMTAPVSYDGSSSAPIELDVTSLPAFESQAADTTMSKDDRDLWRQQIAGQRVRWTGYVFIPHDGIDGPALTSSFDRAASAIHLQTASKAARNELQRIPDGAKVQVDGVLMDDHWLHVIHVTRSW